MQKRDPKPEIYRLEELALQVRVGDIKLPKFQRPFVWKESDILKLFDSIYKGYPIGSLLIWNSSQKLVSEREILGVVINQKTNPDYPTNYLLDGQQRLTSLCGALFWDGKDESSEWNIGFNLDQETFFHMKNAPEGDAYFPLSKLLTTSDFLKQCTKYDISPRGSKHIEKAEQLLRAIKDYKIAVVKIGDMTVEEVAPIFERINSTGRKLTIVDLMMAATWSDNFDLNSEIIKIQEACEDLGFTGTPSKIILRSLSATANLGINKDDIQKLRRLQPKELSKITQKTLKAAQSASAFFMDYMGIYDFSYIPYALQFTHVCEFFNICRDPIPAKVNELKRWLWFTNATRYFGTSNTGQNRSDFEMIRAFAQGKTKYLYDRKEIDISRLLFDKFNLRNATSTSFALLLGESHPQKNLDSSEIDNGYKYLKNSRFYATTLPKGEVFHNTNISMVIHTNTSQKQLANQCVFPNEDQLISVEASEFLSGKNYNDFIVERGKNVAKRISDLTGCPTTYNNSLLPLDSEKNDSSDDFDF